MSTPGRLRISGELPLNARVVNGIAAKHARCMVSTCLNAQSTACDINVTLISKLDRE